MSLNSSGSRTLADTISNDLHRAGVTSENSYPPKHYFEEVRRLRALARSIAATEIDGEKAYLKHFSVTQDAQDRWIFNTEYVVAEHNGKIHLRGMCTRDALTYDPPVFVAPTFCPRTVTPLPIKYRSAE